MPQLLKRHGYTGALHFVMDDGIYPDEEYAKLQWQGADASTVPSYSRIPLAGDSASAFLRFPVRMSESMDHDYVAGLVFARWPELRSPWLDDFRRAQKYAPALGEFITFEKFFSETDLDGRMSEFRRGNYLSPFLVQAVAKREAAPLNRYVEHLQRRRRFEALDWQQATARVLATGRVGGAGEDAASPAADLESLLADAGPDVPPVEGVDIDARLLSAERDSATALAKVLLNGAPGQTGVLVVNSLSFARRIVVDWPAGLAIPAAAAPLVARQFSGDVRQIVVETPPCGYAWIPVPTSDAPLPAPAKTPLAEELVVRNEFLEVTLSNATGGIAQVRTYGHMGNRLSQQLAWRFSREKTLTPSEPGTAEAKPGTPKCGCGNIASSPTARPAVGWRPLAISLIPPVENSWRRTGRRFASDAAGRSRRSRLNSAWSAIRKGIRGPTTSRPGLPGVTKAWHSRGRCRKPPVPLRTNSGSSLRTTLSSRPSSNARRF